MEKQENRGGKREGAGRPQGSHSIVQIERENKVVARKLLSSAEKGWEVLADSYPEIMRTAIRTALGNEKTTPNVALLKTLLELMVKISSSAPSETETVTDALVKGFIADVRASRNTDGAAVEYYLREGTKQPDSGNVQRPSSDQPFSGMGQSFPFLKPQ